MARAKRTTRHLTLAKYAAAFVPLQTVLLWLFSKISSSISILSVFTIQKILDLGTTNTP